MYSITRLNKDVIEIMDDEGTTICQIPLKENEALTLSANNTIEDIIMQYTPEYLDTIIRKQSKWQFGKLADKVKGRVKR